MKNNDKKHKIMVGIMDAVCGMLIALFLFLIVGNTTLMIRGAGNSRPASFLGFTPVIIQSESMSGVVSDHLEKGDLVLATEKNFMDVKEGDIILYMDQDLTICHRVMLIHNDAEGRTLTTKGDANASVDVNPVTEEMYIGVVNNRIPGIGTLINFLASPLGMLLVIGIPVIVIAVIMLKKKKMVEGEKEENHAESAKEV